MTGLGVVTPLGNDIETFWKSLLPANAASTRSRPLTPSTSIARSPAEVKNFDPTPAFPSAKEVRRTDRFAQFGVYAGMQALQDSGLDLEKVNRDEIGVFIGSGIGGLHTTEEQHNVLLSKRSRAAFRLS